VRELSSHLLEHYVRHPASLMVRHCSNKRSATECVWVVANLTMPSC
jgi:hypothetical protein